ncbi:exopolysaccharide biosynthesis protein [Luteimonas viscosa]|uniref:Exopolysaccharide biosynthesis protein n=1 Tax=Luteimonas viscosa TaxID=1132694 RepID=A0A5D4XKJ3_9GAMM|nr:exopolysaccharide biosynthesis protein [Luteimonas viscosa]TYT25218.1 exopolysaccharide biosynthesis protein [Luteimonas viscosa]
MTDARAASGGDDASLGAQIAGMIARLPPDHVTLGELLELFGDEGLLLLCILLTLVFLIPVSIPGVSTVFGAAILLVGMSRLLGRQLWLPSRVRHRRLPSDRLRPGLAGGLRWVQRFEKLSRPHRLAVLVDGRAQDIVNNLAFILAALLLMAPFGFVPFSNTLPALALLAYAIGFIQRDGGAVLLGHLANLGTMVYFSVLIGGGGLVAQELFKRFTA